jgi:outer membrane receptor protein involved in Fe transport
MDKNFTVDMAASYAFNRNIRLFIEAQNLTNEPVRMYLGDKSRTKDLRTVFDSGASWRSLECVLVDN